VRLVLGNDQRLCMDALAAALSHYGVTVLAVARTPHAVLTEVASLKPDICLLAARCSAGSSVDTMQAIRTQHPAVKVVILTDGSDSSLLTSATKIGAAAFVSRRQPVADLVALLQRVLTDERSRGASSALPEVSHFGSVADRESDPRLGHLTVREQEVLTLMVEGQATKEIARSLAITVHTARTHAQSVLVKLGAHSRLEASGMVARHRLLGQAADYAVEPVSRPTGARR
jgi:two-component system, NarL family, nitrate/nitrite response regulator NarL